MSEDAIKDAAVEAGFELHQGLLWHERSVVDQRLRDFATILTAKLQARAEKAEEENQRLRLLVAAQDAAVTQAVKLGVIPADPMKSAGD